MHLKASAEVRHKAAGLGAAKVGRKAARLRWRTEALRGCRGRTAVVLLLAVAKIDVFRKNFRRAALVAFFVFPVPDLQTTGNDGHTALRKILRRKFSRVSPRDDIKKIGFLFPVLLRKIAVYCHGK